MPKDLFDLSPFPKPYKLNIGCSKRPKPGWVNNDIIPFKGVDVLFDLGKDTFPFKDNTFIEIEACHVLEHLDVYQLFHCMDECFRVLQPTGHLHVEVPRWGTQAWLLHPEHKMHWTENLFGFFMVPDNEDHFDQHGYLKGHWRVEFITENTHPEHIRADMFPNKEGMTKYPYVKVKQ